MKHYLEISAAVLLVSLSAVLLPHAYGAYESTRSLVLPNVDALSPEGTSRRVLLEILPLLPAGREGDAARSLLESQASGAANLHKLWVTQAIATRYLAFIQAIGWSTALAASLFLLVWLLRRRHGAA